MSVRLSPEISLVAACCRWPFDGEAVRAAANRPLDWPLVEAIVLRNRVTPLVRHALTHAEVELPMELADRLAERARAKALRALQLARESLALQQAFDGASVALRIVKGAPLAVLAYSELGLKESWDIDLLVAPEQAARAIEVLVELGYQGILADARPSQRDDHPQYGKEAEFRRTGPSITTELHWRLSDNPHLLTGVGVASASQDVPIPGGHLRTLADGELFSYLCVHGTVHNWSRLKWLADVGALLGRRSADDIASLFEAAVALGVGRSAAVALLLCRQLLALPLDQRLLREIGRDSIAQALASNAVAGLAYRHGTFEMRPYTLPWLRMMTGHFFIAPGLGHATEQARYLWNSAGDRTQVALPRGLSFGHHFLRVPLWLSRVAMRAYHRNRA